MAKAKIPVEKLRQLWNYDPVTGSFIWLPRDRSSFGNEGAYQYFKKNLEGRPAFQSINGSGYPTTILTIDGTRTNLSAHIAAFAMNFGRYPEGMIDHINGDRSDNRIINIREVDYTRNSWNSRRSGLVGAQRRGKTWVAVMRSGGRNGPVECLGKYATQEEAHARYVAVCNERRGEFSPFNRSQDQ